MDGLEKAAMREKAAAGSGVARGPLAGLRIVDLTLAMAGPQ